MHFREAIAIAIDTLRSHKLRSFLTLLGVIVSVCTLVAVVSLVQGMNEYVGKKIANLGSNTFEVDQFDLLTDYEQYLQEQKRNKPIRLEDYDYLRATASLPLDIAAHAERTGQVKSGTHVLDQVDIRGTTANYMSMVSFEVAQGRFFAPVEYQHHASVAFVGPDIVNNLFPGADPIGKTIIVDGREYQITGVASVQGNTFGRSQDNFVMLPLTTYQKVYGIKDSVSLDVQAASPTMMAATQDEVRMLMRARRHLKYAEKDNFGIIGAEAIMDLWHSITGAIAAVMVGVSSVFLVVGGIVIMNIMLAAVTERTREIGVRKALGARRRDILRQFLMESGVISTVGGIMGILIAYVFTLVAGALTPIPFSMPLLAVIIAVAVSAGVGLFFGIYPASKAAKLDPIVALRAEV